MFDNGTNLKTIIFSIVLCVFWGCWVLLLLFFCCCFFLFVCFFLLFFFFFFFFGGGGGLLLVFFVVLFGGCWVVFSPFQRRRNPSRIIVVEFVI